MKKLILSAAAMFMLVLVTNAQGFHLGIKAGGNMGKIDGQSFKDGYELGYQLGAFAEIDFNKYLGIQPEILFNQTNTKIAQGFHSLYDSIGSTALGEKVHLNYLSIPILLRINAGKLLTFHLGPQFSIKINDNKNLVENGKDAFKSGDFAAVAGAQLNLGALKVYGRYNIGLNNINDIDNADKWKRQQWQLGLGFRIL